MYDDNRLITQKSIYIRGRNDEISANRPLSRKHHCNRDEARDPFGGNVYYVTIQITFRIPEFARKERSLHCVHITTKWVSRLVLDHAIAAIQTSR